MGGGVEDGAPGEEALQLGKRCMHRCSSVHGVGRIGGRGSSWAQDMVCICARSGGAASAGPGHASCRLCALGLTVIWPGSTPLPALQCAHCGVPAAACGRGAESGHEHAAPVRAARRAPRRAGPARSPSALHLFPSCELASACNEPAGTSVCMAGAAESCRCQHAAEHLVREPPDMVAWQASWQGISSLHWHIAFNSK